MPFNGVFPARVGMNRQSIPENGTPISVPRASGDEPNLSIHIQPTS